MVFKKFDNQQVYQVPCKVTADTELEVGDVFAHNPDSHEIEQITKKADAIETQAEGIRELYLIAQSDAVTEKTGVIAVKTYIIDRTVNLKANEEKVVAAYRITMIDNVEGWED